MRNGARGRMERENEMIQTRASVCAPCFSSSRVFGSRGGGGDGRTAEVQGWDSSGGVREERKSSGTGERRKRKEGGEGRGGGTVAITSLENRLLVSCSCLDCPLSIYLALSFSLTLSLSHSLSDSRCSVGSQRSLSDIPVAHFVPVWRMHKAAM